MYIQQAVWIKQSPFFCMLVADSDFAAARWSRNRAASANSASDPELGLRM